MKIFKNKYFQMSIYCIALIAIPLCLYSYALTVPIPEPRVIDHTLQTNYGDAIIFFLRIGLYLIPLHILFVNKTTLQINSFFFIIIISIVILVPAHVYIELDILHYKDHLIYAFIVYECPFYLIYKIKKNINS